MCLFKFAINLYELMWISYKKLINKGVVFFLKICYSISTTKEYKYMPETMIKKFKEPKGEEVKGYPIPCPYHWGLAHFFASRFF